MERLMNLYRSIQNPLDNLDKLKTIIEAYSESKKNNKSFYSTVLHWNSNNKQNLGTYNPYIEEIIDYWKFVTWKDNIIHMTPEKYAKFYGSEKGYYSNEFTVIQRYLKQIDETISKENFEKIKEEMRNDDRLNKAYKTYDYEIFQSGWDYVSSTDLFENESIETRHRLYINCDSISKYDVIIKIIDGFNENNIPIFFKYNDASRDDTIVLWTDDENLLKTVNMLKIIKEKIPAHTCLEPTILAGTIDGWLGYGSEPTTLLNGEQTSFNKVRTKVIGDAIENAYSQYVLFHKNARGLSEFEIAERDSGFIQTIRDEIIRVGKEYGIDENNFCFDTKTVQHMKQMDVKVNQSFQQHNSINTVEDVRYSESVTLADETPALGIYQIEEKYKKRENQDKKKVIKRDKNYYKNAEAYLESLINLTPEQRKKRENQGKKKVIKRDKNYYKNAEAYLKGLINLTPEQRKRGNQYLSALEQEQNFDKGNKEI